MDQKLLHCREVGCAAAVVVFVELEGLRMVEVLQEEAEEGYGVEQLVLSQVEVVVPA
jgi:hypothetical protein